MTSDKSDDAARLQANIETCVTLLVEIQTNVITGQVQRGLSMAGSPTQAAQKLSVLNSQVAEKVTFLRIEQMVGQLEQLALLTASSNVTSRYEMGNFAARISQMGLPAPG